MRRMVEAAEKEMVKGKRVVEEAVLQMEHMQEVGVVENVSVCACWVFVGCCWVFVECLLSVVGCC